MMFCCSGSVLFSLIWCFLDTSNNFSFNCHIKYSTTVLLLAWYIIFRSLVRGIDLPLLCLEPMGCHQGLCWAFSLYTFPCLSVVPEGCWLPRSQQSTTSHWWCWRPIHPHTHSVSALPHRQWVFCRSERFHKPRSYQYISVLSCCGNYSQENKAYSLNFTLHQFRTNCFMKPIRKYLFTDTFLWTRVFVFPYHWLEVLSHPDPLCPSLDR